MKSLLRFAALAGAALLLTAGSVQAQPKDKVVLMLNWYLYSEHAPFFLGKERGYYEQEGIDLDIQEGRGSGVTVQAVAANTATFGYVDVPTMIKAAAKGAPVKSRRRRAAALADVGDGLLGKEHPCAQGSSSARPSPSRRATRCRRSGRCSSRRPGSTRPTSRPSPATRRPSSTP